MNKKTKKIIVGSTAAILLAGTVTPIAVFAFQGNTVSNVNDKTVLNSSKSNFDHNIDEYTDKIIKQQPLIEFDAKTGLKPYETVPTNAKESLYNPIFSKINKEVITNDIYNFLQWMQYSYNNSIFKYKITNLLIEEKQDSRYHIELNFDIYNPFAKDSLFIFNQTGETNNLAFDWYEIKNTKIIIDSPAIPMFNRVEAGIYDDDLYAGYFFKDAIWQVGDQNLKFDKFFFNIQSPTINTVIKGVEKGRDYLEFDKVGNEALSTMTVNDFDYDFENNLNNYFDNSVIVAGALQRMFREIIKDQPIEPTLKTIASDANILTEAILKMTSPELKGFGNVIELILQNPTIYELISSKEFKEGVSNLTSVELPYFEPIISMLMGVMEFNSKEQFEETIKILLYDEDVKKLLKNAGITNPEQFLNDIWDLKDDGVLTILSKANNLISQILDLLNPNKDNQFLNFIYSAYNLLFNYDISKTSIVDWMIAVLKTKDPVTNENVLKSILSKFIPSGSAINTVLNMFVFNNSSLSKNQLIGLFDFLANPTSNGKIVGYEEFAKNMKVEFGVGESNTYDPLTHQLNAHYSIKYTIGQNIRFDLTKIHDLLPSSLAIVIPMLPDYLELFNNDYIKVDFNFNDVVKYDLVKTFNGQSKVSWQALVDQKIDVNMPQTAIQLYNRTGLLAKNTLLDLYNTLFYSEFTMGDNWKPVLSSKLNKVLVSDYNPNKKTNEQILVNQIPEDELKKLTEELKKQIVLKQYDDQSYQGGTSIWGKPWYIYKRYTQTNIDINAIDSKIFDRSNYKHDFRVYLDSNFIVPTMKLLGISLPNESILKLNLVTPYKVYSNDGMMQNTWTFNF